MKLRALLVLLLTTGCVRRVAVDALGDEPQEDPPAGMVGLSAYSEPEDARWDVLVNNEQRCTTPCAEFVKPSDYVSLARNDGTRLDVFDLATAAPGAKNAIVVAEGESEGLKVNGITFTTLGGMGLVTGVVLTAVGCSDLQERAGLCTAGLIVGGISLPLTVAAIWMLVASGPKVHVLEVPTKGTPVTLQVTPTGVMGSF